MVIVMLLGILVGAVVNRLGSDLPARRRPRLPECPYCGRRRPWYQWVSLPAFLGHHQHCPSCGALISIRHPLVELGLAFLFGFLYWRYGLTAQFVFFALYTTIFMLIAITDIERRLILNGVTLPAMALAIVGSFFSGHISWKSALLGGVVAYVILMAIVLLGNWLVGPGAMGGGDVKLAAFIGLVTGFPLVLEALLLGILMGGVVSLFLLLMRLRSLRDPIPYGPFLILGGWVTMIWGLEIAEWFFR
ncbi:MAG: prepilin peptidase [Anaerolineae bacterium]